MNNYDLKTLLHSITLFPAIYLACKGTLVYKKFSFKLARKDFKTCLWDVIDEVTSIREKWKYAKAKPILPLSKINPLLHAKISSIFLQKNIAKENGINTKKLIEKMNMLSENAWGKVKKNAV